MIRSYNGDKGKGMEIGDVIGYDSPRALTRVSLERSELSWLYADMIEALDLSLVPVGSNNTHIVF